MPKSKRAKVVHLTKTEKKTRASKEQLFTQIRESCDAHRYLWVFRVENMRNLFLKEIRDEWKGKGRFFMGKNRIMAKALGTDEQSAYQANLDQLQPRLNGNVGILFTNAEPEEVQSYFGEYIRQDYARAGSVATETIVLPSGPVTLCGDPFPNSMETQLRGLGVPSSLKNGVVLLGGEYTICREGQVLTVDQAKLLKMFCIQMATFQVRLLAYWCGGEVTTLISEEELSAENDADHEELMLE